MILTAILDTSGLDKLSETFVNQTLEIIIDTFGSGILQSIVRGILGESSEEVSPCEIVYAVLPSQQSTRCYLCIQMVYYLSR